MACAQPTAAIGVDNIANVFQGRDMGMATNNSVDMFAARFAENFLFKIIDKMQSLLPLLANEFCQ